MELILWRHADAEDAAPGGSDDARKLTAEGRKQARRMAVWLRKRLPEDALILASPARRAQETARALSTHFKTSRDVGTEAGAQTVLKAVDWPNGEGVVVVVGHQPTLGKAVALVLTGSADDLSMKKGGIWWLESRDRGEVVVRAVISPDLL